jgi:RNA polymerase sigma-70 factor (ECF subfamily)
MSVTTDPVFRYDHVIVVSDIQDEQVPLRDLADSALVAKAQRGSAEAFEVLVRRYRNDVFAMSYHFVRNREQAWDIAQESFVKAYRSLKWFRGEAGFKTWLLRIAANHSKDYLKKRRLDTTPFDEVVAAVTPDTAPGPDRQLEAEELGRAIQAAVAELSAKHREAFVLREYQGLSYQEMAEVMGCSLGTVMSRLHHARKKLQDALTRMGVVDG